MDKFSFSKWLVPLFVFVLLVGCGSNGNKSSEKVNEPTSTTNQQQSSQTETEKPVVDPDRTSLPINKTKITFWNPDTATWQPLYEKLIADFESIYPEIEVNMINIPQSGYFEKLNTAFAAQDGPDVWVGWYSPAEYDKGYIQALDEYAEADKIDFNAYFQPATDSRGLGADGKRYAMIRDVSMTLLTYNKSLFHQYGVELPKEEMTIDEFRQVLKDITHAEDGVYGTDMANVKTLPGSPFVWNMGGDLIDVTGTKSAGVIDSQGTINAFKFLQEIKANGTNVPLDIMSALPEGSNSAIQSGKIAFSRAELYSYNKLIELPFEWGVVAYPHDPEHGVNYGYVSVVNFLMNAKSDKKNESWALMKYLSSERAGNIVAEDMTWMPGIKSTWYEKGWDKDEKLGVFYAQGNKQLKPSLSSRSNMWKVAVETAYKKAFTESVEPLKGEPKDPAVTLKIAAEESQGIIDRELK